jgi:hypothetical protein
MPKNQIVPLFPVNFSIMLRVGLLKRLNIRKKQQKKLTWEVTITKQQKGSLIFLIATPQNSSNSMGKGCNKEYLSWK